MTDSVQSCDPSLANGIFPITWPQRLIQQGHATKVGPIKTFLGLLLLPLAEEVLTFAGAVKLMWGFSHVAAGTIFVQGGET